MPAYKHFHGPDSIQRATRYIVWAAVAVISAGADASSASTLKNLYDFKDGKDGGRSEAGLIMDRAGALYGTTEYGGEGKSGVVFKLTPPSTGQSKWAETVLYSLNSSTMNDGRYPIAGLFLDKHGALYGTTWNGGAYAFGTVFKLTPPAAGKTAWTETILHSFGKDEDGAGPTAGVIMSESGTLYGTTNGGGANSCYCGTVFRLRPPVAGKSGWKETILHSFTDGEDGGLPYGGLIMDGAGALYGTTSQAGPGAVFGEAYKLTPPTTGTAWTETVLHAFAGEVDGAIPMSNLTMDGSGNLYGTTEYGGGSPSAGTVFELSPPGTGDTTWTETILHSFSADEDGGNPYAGVIVDGKGTVFGTTLGGAPAAVESCTNLHLRRAQAPGGRRLYYTTSRAAGEAPAYSGGPS